MNAARMMVSPQCEGWLLVQGGLYTGTKANDAEERQCRSKHMNAARMKASPQRNGCTAVHGSVQWLKTLTNLKKTQTPVHCVSFNLVMHAQPKVRQPGQLPVHPQPISANLRLHIAHHPNKILHSHRRTEREAEKRPKHLLHVVARSSHRITESVAFALGEVFES